MSELAVKRRPDLSVSELPQAELLARLDQANEALNAAKTLPELKAVRDKIAAIEGYLRQRERSEAVANEATRIKLRAERRLGELLEKRPKDAGGRPAKTPSTTLGVSADRPKLKDLGITYTQSSRWQKVAALPEAVVEAKIDAATEKGEQISAKEVVRQTTKETRPERAPAPPLPEGVFNLIYADPPWQDDLERGTARDVEAQYQTLPLPEIQALKAHGRPITDAFAADCFLFLWARNCMLREAFSVIEAWGFEYVTNAVWVKGREGDDGVVETVGMGTGYHFRDCHELLLLAKRANPGGPTARDVRSVICSPRRAHSQKPDSVREILARMYPEARRLELFARGQAPDGWTFWGLETTND